MKFRELFFQLKQMGRAFCAGKILVNTGIRGSADPCLSATRCGITKALDFFLSFGPSSSPNKMQLLPLLHNNSYTIAFDLGAIKNMIFQLHIDRYLSKFSRIYLTLG
jgi:hypothetical protein